MGAAAPRDRKPWLAGSAVIAVLLVAAVLCLELVQPAYRARALVLLAPAGSSSSPDLASPSSGTGIVEIVLRGIDGLVAPPRASREGTVGVVVRQLPGTRLLEVAASAADPEGAAVAANRAAGDLVAVRAREAEAALARARSRAAAAASLSVGRSHPLDTPVLGALRRALAAIVAERERRPSSFATIGAEEMSTRRQLAREVAAIRRRAVVELEAALARAENGRASRVISAATASHASLRPSVRAALSAAVLAGTALAALLAILLLARLRRS